MKIVLTGGGTAGHVTPNIALIPTLIQKNFEVHYIGSHTGIEKELITKQGINYYSISSGKLRRYVDIKNLTDCFRIVKGLGDSISLLRRIRPNVVFSKGGFVVVPVAIAAQLLGIPVVIHESDITPGLANRIIMPIAKSICLSFPETLTKVPSGKGVLTGSPIRKELWEGDSAAGLKICAFDKLPKKPVLLAMGGSLGAAAINRQLTTILPKLLQHFYVIHLCGKGNMPSKPYPLGYAPFEYVEEELPHLLAASDIVISRAGANTIFELQALAKPNLLIPLSKAASRGDQILNAASFEKQGYSKVLQEENISELYESIISLYESRTKYIQQMGKSKPGNGIKRVVAEIERWTK